MSISSKENKKKSHLIGFARVSTEDQNLDLQRDALVAAGVSPLDIYEEKISGAAKKRPEFDAMWKDLREGDTLVIWKLDRLSRDAGKLWQMIEEIHKRGCNLVITTLNIDAREPAGRLVFGVLASVAQFERDLGIARTKAGLASARARGRVGGRKRLLSDDEAQKAFSRMEAGEFLADIASSRKPPLTPQAYYNRFKKLGLVPKDGSRNVE